VFSSLVLKECKYCASVVKDVESARARGYVITEGGVTVEIAIASAGDPKEGLLIYSRTSQKPSVIRDAAGVIRKTAGTKANQTEAVVVWQRDGWRVAGVKVTKVAPR